MTRPRAPYGCRECARLLEYVFDRQPDMNGGNHLVFACADHPDEAATYDSNRHCWRDERPGQGEPEHYRVAASLVQQMEERRRHLSEQRRLSAKLDDDIGSIASAFSRGLVEDAAGAAHRFLENTRDDHGPEKEDAFDGYLQVREAPPAPGALFNPPAHLSADRNRRLADALVHRRWLEAEGILGARPVTVFRVYCRRLLEALRGTWIPEADVTGRRT